MNWKANTSVFIKGNPMKNIFTGILKKIRMDLKNKFLQISEIAARTLKKLF